MADPLDLLSIAEAREAISRESTNKDDTAALARHVTAVSNRIDEVCGPVVKRAVTAELIDPCGSDVLTLSKRPVMSITTVRESHWGSITTVEAVAFGGSGPGYRVDLRRGQLRRLGCCWTHDQVEVTYVAGRCEDTASVPARFKDAAGAVLRRLWKREAGAWQQSAEFIQTLDSGDGLTASAGFFKIADPVINEMLAGERDMTRVA